MMVESPATVQGHDTNERFASHRKLHLNQTDRAGGLIASIWITDSSFLTGTGWPWRDLPVVASCFFKSLWQLDWQLVKGWFVWTVSTMMTRRASDLLNSSSSNTQGGNTKDTPEELHLPQCLGAVTDPLGMARGCCWGKGHQGCSADLVAMATLI